MKSTDLKDVYAIDECSILLLTKVKKVVAKRGSKPVLKTERKFKGVNIIGGIRGNKEVVFQILEHKSNKDAFLKFLGYLHHVNEYKPSHVILDNIYFHKAKDVLAFARENAISLHFQPKHSPHFNAAEEIWRQLRQWLRGQLFYSLDRLKESIYEFFILHPWLNINISSYLT